MLLDFRPRCRVADGRALAGLGPLQCSLENVVAPEFQDFEKSFPNDEPAARTVIT